MDERPVPGGIDVTTPNVARMYDFYLGGKDNYEADRAAAAEVLKSAPQAPALARENRAFLGRVVRYLARDAGVRQFLDVGAGLPTQGNVHEVARRETKDARVVYADNDPVVLTHGRALLGKTPGTVVIPGDLRNPSALLADPDLRAVLNLDEPVALLLISVLHCLDDAEDPWATVAEFRDALPSGSHLAISHITAADHGAAATAGARVYRRANTGMTLRDRAAITRFFEGFDLVDPGVVRLTDWRPESRTRSDLPTWYWCGLARKP
ncbi:SAM-dependent methyltransferase [Actinomadura rayongensis]|uniref:SAM-dependent methyltransferase n=1 Tax=Actinomadura rayongensis TaxID=1429076 RepID=A0A6I4W2M2_9ACTN|nr:SAM-dependent methyltransferase [Actinomadura rayongensis]